MLNKETAQHFAEIITEYIFTNAFGDKADSIVLMSDNRDLGGWGLEQFRSKVAKILTGELKVPEHRQD